MVDVLQSTTHFHKKELAHAFTIDTEVDSITMYSFSASFSDFYINKKENMIRYGSLIN